jgi:hypothetical protein
METAGWWASMARKWFRRPRNNRAAYRDEMREAVVMWEARLAALLAGTKT